MAPIVMNTQEQLRQAFGELEKGHVFLKSKVGQASEFCATTWCRPPVALTF